MMCALPTAASVARASGAAVLLGTLLLLVAACGGVESPDSNGGSLADRVGETAAAQPERDSAADGAQQQVSSDRDEPLPAASVVPSPRPLPQRRFEVPPAPKVVLAEDTPPLHRAAFDGDLEAVRELLEQGELPDDVFHDGGEAYRTPLAAAATNDHVQVVKLLVEWGASVGYQAISAAAIYNDDPAMVELLLELIDDDFDTDHLIYAMGSVAAYGSPAMVEVVLDAMLEAGLHVDSVTRRGNETALHHAAQSNPDPEVTQLLLARGADIGAYASWGDYSQGFTPLHFAAYTNPEPAVAETILQWAEDAEAMHRVVGARNAANDSTPLHWAARHQTDGFGAARVWELSREEDDATGAIIVGLLLDYGGDIEVEDQYKGTPLLTAVRHHSHITAAALLDRGADISIRSRGQYGRVDFSLLHWAAEGRPSDPTEEAYAAKVATIKLLLDRGLNINDRDGRGKTPLLIALESRDRASVKFLLEAGANPQFKDREDITPCSMASDMSTWGGEDGPALSKLFEGRCQ